MCKYNVRVRGIKVMGRQVYRTDTGVRCGYRGPQVSLESACLDLDPVLAAMLTRACHEIDRKMTERQQQMIDAATRREEEIEAEMNRQDAEYAATEQQAREVFGDEPEATIISLNPPHIDEWEDEQDNDPPETYGEDYRS